MTSRSSRLLFLAACGATVTFGATATAQLSVDTSDRAAVAAFYRTWFASTTANVTPNWTGAAAGCSAGSYGQAYRDALLTRINAYRALAGVASLAHEDSTTFSGMAEQRAALLLKTSGLIGERTLSRRTPCWTLDGDRALVNSYQDDGVGTDSVDASMRGATSPYNQSMLLQPTTVRVRVGSTDAELLINRPDTQDVFPNTGSVAWPGAGFQPYQTVPDSWCFNAQSLPWDPTITSRHDFFDSATVTVRRNGVALNITTSTKDRRAWNWNGITWTFAPGQLQHGPGMGDVTYDVSIQGILGIRSSYSYSVTVFDPVTRGSFSPYGTSCGGLVLRAANGGVPTLGIPFQVELAGGSFVGDLVGVNLGAQQLNISLAPFGAPNCFLYAEILVAQGRFAANPVETFTFPLPNDQALAGVSVQIQGVALHARTGTRLTTSHGARLTLGQ